ncbi:hypothetical protein DH86_00004201, partial [Scytalidium sp. 3C]
HLSWSEVLRRARAEAGRSSSWLDIEARRVFAVLLAAATAVSAGAVTTCHANDCLRQIRASNFPTRSGFADCTAYFGDAFPTTYTEQAVTTTTTITTVVTPPAIPAYASSCDYLAYSSACSCVGAGQSTITIPASTVTATVYSTITEDYWPETTTTV